MPDNPERLSSPSAAETGETREELKEILTESKGSDTNPLFTRMSQLARLEENFRYP